MVDVISNSRVSIKKPPSSIEAEQLVLGGLMLEPHLWDEVSPELVVEDFFRTSHQVIFEQMGKLSEKGIPIDAITLAEHLGREEALGKADGTEYIVDLANNTSSAQNIMAYTDIVKQRSLLRRLILATSKISDLCYFPKDKQVIEVVGDAQRLVAEAVEGVSSDKSDCRMNEGLKIVMDAVDEAFHGDEVSVLKTGFIDVDKNIAISGGKLIVVAGRPSMGKSTIASNLAEGMIKEGKHVAFFSMEMSSKEVFQRIVSSQSGIPLEKILKGNFQDSDWQKFTMTAASLKSRNLVVNDEESMTIPVLRSRLRSYERSTGKVDAVVIDYLQLMSGSSKNNHSRADEVAEITRGLKSVAKEFDCPVIALSQLNRDLEKRPLNDRRPRLSDLRESGSIEQDADIVSFIYRDGYYNPNAQNPNVSELIVAKNRNGKLSTIYLLAELEKMRFKNMAAEAPQPKKETARGGLNF